MEFGVWTKGLAALSVDCLVVGVFEEARARRARPQRRCGLRRHG